MNIEEENVDVPTKNTSFPYLIYTFGFGLAIIFVLVYSGYNGYPFVISILIGALFQVIFRITKRMWSNNLNKDFDEVSTSRNPLIAGFVETLPTFKIFFLIYVAMVFVSALWFGMGKAAAWFFG